MGSDSWYYQQDEKYNVICIGEDIGVENYTPDFPVHGIIANPANGRLKEFLGKPDMVYQPWEFGSPWTKKTALWGNFNKPSKLYSSWEDVPKLGLYTRGGRKKPSLAYLHVSAINKIPEFHKFKDRVKVDADLRSLRSQGFAKAFYEANK